MDSLLKICVFLIVFLFEDFLMFEILNIDSNMSSGDVICEVFVSNLFLLL